MCTCSRECRALGECSVAPDDADGWLTLLEAQVAAERARLEATGGARRCRYCQLDVPAGPGAGVHEACLPKHLPDGARSCVGCGELILDDDDDFEHDFCDCPGDETSRYPREGMAGLKTGVLARQDQTTGGDEPCTSQAFV